MYSQHREREQPIFSARAHVFQIDPATKRNWIPASKHAVTVSFFYDASRNVYRIISVGGTKAIINSTVTPNMTFTKTSQKFGQWADSRANTVYGLGFATEQQLLQFSERFKEVKEAARLAREKSQEKFELSNPGLNITAPQTPPTLSINGPGEDKLFRSRSADTELSCEKERVRKMLSEGSICEINLEAELFTLQDSNAKLVAALQEANANVEQWKKQLAAYQVETDRLRDQAESTELLSARVTNVLRLRRLAIEQQNNPICPPGSLDSALVPKCLFAMVSGALICTAEDGGNLDVRGAGRSAEGALVKFHTMVPNVMNDEVSSCGLRSCSPLTYVVRKYRRDPLALRRGSPRLPRALQRCVGLVACVLLDGRPSRSSSRGLCSVTGV
ncbi:hypothetical protein GN956_G14342 [Arapaima gigas]